MDFDLLPLEIKSQILNYLTERELQCKVIPVCKNWRDLVNSSYGRKSLDVNNRYSSSTETIRLLQLHAGINSLKVTNITDWRWLINSPTRSNVKTLIIHASFLSFKTISYLTRKFPMVIGLKISACTLKSEYSINAVPEWKYLKVLSLSLKYTSFRTCINDKDVIDFKYLTLNCNCLEDLRIDNEISDYNLDTILTGKGSQLKKLYLGNAGRLSSPGFRALNFCTNLTHLEMAEVYIFRKIELLDKLELQSLEELVLKGFNQPKHWARNDIDDLFSRCVFPNLSVLMCEMFNLTNVGINAIAKKSPRLRALHLNYTEVNEVGLQEILQQCSQLENICINGKPYTTTIANDVSG